MQTDASRVLGTKVWGRNESTPLRWKEPMLKVPVCRRIRGTTLTTDKVMEPEVE